MSRREGQDESRRILGRVGAESEARMASAGAEGDDWAEMWGKRIGRVLAFVLLGFALVSLYNFLVLAG